MATMRRASVLVATCLALVASTFFAPSASAASYPSVVITAPTDGSTVSGVVAITVQGDTDPMGADTTSVLSVSVDGAPFAAYDCAANNAGASCLNSFNWDTTGLTGTHTIDATLSTVLGDTATATTTTVTVSSPSPVASVTSPADGATVSGLVNFGGQGVVDATQTDSPSTLTFYVDGKALSAQSCSGNTVGKTCATSVQWDSTGLSGTHVLTVGFATTNGLTVTSAPATVTVNSPVPTAVVNSPADGSTVSGQVTISVTGTVDPSQNDAPGTLTVSVDGTVIKAQSCASIIVNNACSTSAPWNSTGLTGTHTISVSLKTTRGLTVTSAPTTVTVSSPLPTIAITSPTTNDTVSGLVSVNVSGSIDPSQIDSIDHINLVDGSTVVAAVNCANVGMAQSCTTSLNWDATGLSGTHSLRADLYSTNGLKVQSNVVTVNVSSPAPTVSITAPSDKANVAGDITFNFNAKVDVSQVDYVDHIDLYDNNNLVTTYSCAAAQSRTCSGSWVWHATGVSGDHTWLARVTTHRNIMASSGATLLHVSAPAPAVTIASPTNSATVSGLVQIDATGTVDTTQVDTASQLILYVGGTKVSTYQCAGTTKSCHYVFSWNATGLGGARSLVVEVVTANGVHAQSATTNVTVSSPAPVAAIANVKDGDTVAGVVNFDVTGTVDSSQVDSTQSISLFLDGSKIRTATCSPMTPSKTCESILSYDFTGMSGDHVVYASVTTANNLTSNGPSETIHVVSPAPTVGITSVNDGDTLAGMVTLNVHGAIDSTQSDFVDTLRVYIDGTLSRTSPCSSVSNVTSCDASFTWDVSKLVGDHTLRSEILTTRGRVVSGATLTVHVSNPNPAVAITTPIANAVVKGFVTVHADAAVANNVIDYAERITLFVDGVEYTHYTCSSSGQTPTCGIDFSWNANALIGQHTLSASFLTTNGVTVTSDPVTVTVFADTALTATATRSVVRGASVKVSGVLTTVVGAQPVANAPVALLVAPATGASRVINVTTDVNGRYSATYSAKANTTVTASYAGTTTTGLATAKAKTVVRLAILCKSTPRRPHMGQVIVVHCSAAGLLNGPQAWLQVASRGNWHTVLVASAGGTNRTFKVKAVAHGVLALHVVIPSNRYYVSSTSAVFTIVIR